MPLGEDELTDLKEAGENGFQLGGQDRYGEFLWHQLLSRRSRFYDFELLTQQEMELLDTKNFVTSNRMFDCSRVEGRERHMYGRKFIMKSCRM